MPHPSSLQRPQFLFVGNGPYENRGCEAIVRGTVEILRKEFGKELVFHAGVYGSQEQAAHQNRVDAGLGITSFLLKRGSPRRWSFDWWQLQSNKRLGTGFQPTQKPLVQRLASTTAALELGGDNYSLDYGRPISFLAMDRFLQSRRVPVILWGASVGPFDEDREFAPQMFDHLRSLTAILVRETGSLDHLRANGVAENVHLVADPAFVMKPIPPAEEKLGFTIPKGAVGLNLSPLVAGTFMRQPRVQWAKGGFDLVEWNRFSQQLVKLVAEITARPIVLVPHVGWKTPENDDFSFLKSLRQATMQQVKTPIMCLPEGLNASETKWVISQCDLFIGARTHATIAALSSEVPTLSLGYSLKAKGINQDIFGHLNYCLGIAGLQLPVLRENLAALVQQASAVRAHLSARIPEVKAAAFRAGPILRKVLAL